MLLALARSGVAGLGKRTWGAGWCSSLNQCKPSLQIECSADRVKFGLGSHTHADWIMHMREHVRGLRREGCVREDDNKRQDAPVWSELITPHPLPKRMNASFRNGPRQHILMATMKKSVRNFFCSRERIEIMHVDGTDNLAHY